jgi:stage III sporulation protein AG
VKKVEELKEKLAGIFKNKKSLSIIVVIGIIGIILIFISDFLPSSNKENTKTTQITGENTQAYSKMLEERIKKIVSEISGAGKATVMVTVDNTTEYIYEKDTKKSNEKSDNTQNGGAQTIQEKQSDEQQVVITGQSANEQPLIKTTVEPRIKGVVVVCEGGNNLDIQQKILSAVTTVLGITSNRVCVTN